MRAFVRVFPRDSTLPLWNSGERKCRAPSGNVSPSSSEIGLRLASKPILGRLVTQPLTLSMSQESAQFWSVIVVNLDLRPSRRGFVLTTNSEEAFRSRFNDRSAEDSLHIRNWRLQMYRLLKDRKIFSVPRKRGLISQVLQFCSNFSLFLIDIYIYHL